MKYLLIILFSIPFLVSAQGEYKPSKGVEALISQISGKNMVYGKFVGFAGSTPGEFMAFEQFVQKANLEEMKFYLNDKDASIRAYAFWALSVKHPAVAKSLLRKLGSDKAEISTMLGGCIMQVETVEDFRAQILKAPSSDLFSSGKSSPKKSSTSVDY